MTLFLNIYIIYNTICLLLGFIILVERERKREREKKKERDLKLLLIFIHSILFHLTMNSLSKINVILIFLNKKQTK